MTITMHVTDKYNFNKGMSDIASGTPNAVNGRFSTLGWTKSFNTIGQATRIVTWNKGNIGNSTNITSSDGR